MIRVVAAQFRAAGGGKEIGSVCSKRLPKALFQLFNHDRVLPDVIQDLAEICTYYIILLLDGQPGMSRETAFDLVEMYIDKERGARL